MHATCDVGFIGAEPIFRKGADMAKDDRSYYQHRAAVEAARARMATASHVQRAHSRLAAAYRGRLASDELGKVELA